MTTKKRTGGLVISRRVDESIQIGDDITVQVVKIKGNSAKLRIIGPRATKVFREEIVERMSAEAEPLVPAEGAA